MQIHLTEEAADFSAKLRLMFTSGFPKNRYRPQPKTAFNALIADCVTNGWYSEFEPIAELSRTTAAVFPLTENSETHKGLEKIGLALSNAFPDRREDNYRRYLETVVEKIALFYGAESRWTDTRTIVKKHIVKDHFMKSKHDVGFDVAERVWKKFAKIDGGSDDTVLEAMDSHLKAFCGSDAQKFKNQLERMEPKVADVKSSIKNSHPRFVVLNIDEAVKLALAGAIAGDFEPYFAAILDEDLPKSGKGNGGKK